MKTMHTPGPWGRNIKPARKYSVIFAGRNTHVATVCVQGFPDVEVEANLDLIVAAPFMLDVLKEVANCTPGEPHGYLALCVARAKEAITKAEGCEP